MGAGTKLLQAVEKIAVELGYSKFFIETYRHSDFDAARAFYQANGFSQVGHIDNYLPDASQMVVYAKTIGS
jgi:ribosomal protein S18 acetylase RimI-like enzyme